MKKLLCFLLCLTLVFSSVSLCFGVDWSSTDQQNLSNAASRLFYNNQSAAYYLYQIYTRLGTLSNTVTDIKNALFDSNHSIAYWVSAINSWMQPIYTSITSGLVSQTDIIPIISGLNEVVSDGSNISYYPYLKYNNKSAANWLSDIQGILNRNGYAAFDATNVAWVYPGPNGTSTIIRFNASGRNWIDNLIQRLTYINQDISTIYGYEFQYLANGYNTSQSLVSFADPDSTVTFTPTSAFDGVYKYFNALNTPIARLGYSLASDQRIEAQEAAAANEQAVVDNFIDSSGDGAASTSDIGSVSDLSSGYKQNFGTDASPSGIFDIFNSDHATWFSQETKNQLDTSTSTRLTKGSESETPLLDKQIEDIYNALGVKQP